MSNVLKIIAVIVGVSLVLGASILLLPSLIEDNPFTGNTSIPGENPNPTNPSGIQGQWSVGEKRNEETPIPSTSIPKSITFSGTEGYTVSLNQKDIELTNPKVNQANFVFTVTDVQTGEVIADKVTVAPGQYAYINVYDHYAQAGTYDVQISISAFSFAGQKLNGATSKAVVTVL